MALPTSPNETPKGVVPPEWPTQAADALVGAVAKVRDKTTKPAVIAARAVVYGLVAGVIGLIALVMLLILLIRLANNYLPGHVWWIYAGLFVVFTTAGLVLLKKANRPASA